MLKNSIQCENNYVRNASVFSLHIYLNFLYDILYIRMQMIWEKMRSFSTFAKAICICNLIKM